MSVGLAKGVHSSEGDSDRHHVEGTAAHAPCLYAPIYHVVCPHTRYHIVPDGGHKALCPPSTLRFYYVNHK